MLVRVGDVADVGVVGFTMIQNCVAPLSRDENNLVKEAHLVIRLCFYIDSAGKVFLRGPCSPQN